MSGKNQESVKLLIEAEYLAEQEFQQASDDVRKLAKQSEDTDKALDKLKIDKATIESYKDLTERVEALKEGIQAQTLVQKESAKEHGKQSKEYKKESRDLAKLKDDLSILTKSRNADIRKIKEYDITSKTLDKTLDSLNGSIKEGAVASEEQAKALKNANATLEQSITKQRALAEEKKRLADAETRLAGQRKQLASTMKSELQAQDKLNKATNDAIAQKEKEIEAIKRSNLAKQAEEQALKETQAALSKYETKLNSLNAERDKGHLSQADWIRAEERLRNELKLTTSQVNTHKKTLEAEAKELKETTKAMKPLSERLELYTKAMKELNKQKENGLITSSALARKEKELRKEYVLTEARVKQTRKEIEKKTATVKSATSSTDALTRTTRRLAQAYTLLLAGSKAIEAIGSSITQFGEVEAGMTKVEKTTGLARDSVENLKNELNDMAVNITPTATKELLGYAEVAGQLGVTSKQGILDLVVASDALQSSTNLAGDEAVKLLTRMLMMSGEGVGAIHNLSSAVVELGNTTATTEDEIVHMGKEMLTAGASIGLSTDQAVAWGATLKEAGQTAERSRTAMQRLAGTIKKASVEGGSDLIKLTEITGMTAQAIQKGLGEEPERVMLAFVQGLNRIKEEGQVVATTLEDLGISSIESQAVLEKLGDVSLRLAQNMDTASQAYIDQDRHLIEASKAYADQESAIGRVVNRLHILQERLGEAFSDDTNKAVHATTEAISDYEEAIINLGQVTSDALGGMVELLEPWKEALDATGSALLKVGAIFKAVFNSFQSGVDVIILGWQKIAFAIANVTGESDVQLSSLADAIENTKTRILKNNKDLADSQSLLLGEMSYAYIDLRDAIAGNEQAIKSLTEQQQLELKGMMRNGAYREEDNKRYRELTSIITRQTRALEIADAQSELKASNEKARVNEKLRSERLLAESTEKATILAKELFKAEKQLSEYTKELGESLASGAISQQEYNEKAETAQRLIDINTEKTKKLTDAQDSLNQKKIEEIEAGVRFVELTQDETEASTKLIESIQKKEAEIRKLEISQVGLNSESEAYIALQGEITALTTDAISELKKLNELRELEDLTLSQVLEVQEKHIAKLAELKKLRDEDKLTIQQYNEEVEKLSVVTEFLNNNISDVITTQKEKEKADEKAIENAEKLAKAQEKEADESKKKAIQSEYEAKTIQELIGVKVEHEKQLDRLLAKYEDGELTWAEYQLELEKMSVVTDILSKALANNTSEVAKNIDLLNNHAEAMDRNEKIAERFARKTEERAKTQFSMLTATSSGFDATTASAKELEAEMNTLEYRIYKNSKVMRGSWWHELAASQVELDKTSLATARQARAILTLQDRYERLQNPTRQATQAIADSINAMGDLDNATLNALRSEVEETMRSFDDMRKSINDSLDSVEDRLSKLKGDEIAIQERAHAKELSDAEAQKALASGDREALAQAELLIKKLKEAQAIERANLKAEASQAKAEAVAQVAEKEQEKEDATTTFAESTASAKQTTTVTSGNVQPIIINLGSKSAELTANKDDIMSLLTEMGYTLS